MERSKSQTLQRNERIKHLATSLTGLGVALMAGTFLRWQLQQTFDVEGMGWIAGAVCLIFLASLFLTLLQAEDEL